MTSIPRLRIVFAGLAILLLVPLVLLIDRALASERNERLRRHQLVAERIIDEMERELTTFLRREEDRPFEHYRRVALASGGARPGLSHSPLSEPPSEPFILGYFQIEPDGTVTSPREPAGEVERARLDELEATVREHWDDSRARTPALTDLRVEETLEAESKVVEAEPPESALSQLNRGASGRQERQAKLAQTPAANVYGPSRDELSYAAEEAAAVGRFRSAPSVSSSVEALDRGRGNDDAPQAGAADAEALSEADQAPVDLRVEPMVGNRVDAQRMVLYRTVVVDAVAYRQGMLVDGTALLRWLEARVIQSSDLGAVARVVEADGLATAGAYRFRHEFADPFSPIASRIELAELSELSGSSYVVALSVLLLLAATVGLFAAYRMSSVAVAYAARRQDFVSAVSHELKTPLTAIRMYGEMLRDDLVASEDKRRHYYEVITSETERLTRLVNNVLELGRLERRERPARSALGDVRPVVEDAIALFASHAESEGFHVEAAIAPDLPNVRFDRDGLSQVVFNLLDNAVKYAKRARRREVIVSGEAVEDAVRIEVRDFGPGVDAAKLERIFEPFYRGESEMTRTAKGTGIGLSLVRGLVEGMGGTVTAYVPESGGFVVRLTLRA